MSLPIELNRIADALGIKIDAANLSADCALAEISAVVVSRLVELDSGGNRSTSQMGRGRAPNSMPDALNRVAEMLGLNIRVRETERLMKWLELMAAGLLALTERAADHERRLAELDARSPAAKAPVGRPSRIARLKELAGGCV